MNARIRILELMDTSGIKFGTSGARGLVTALTDRVAYAYATAFVQYLEQKGDLRGKSLVFLAGDRRSSTPRIKAAISRAICDRGHEPVDCGLVPSPAIALYGLERSVPAVMVTGSHIPDDRNGIKFNTRDGEITKADEAGIAGQTIDVPEIFESDGRLKSQHAVEQQTTDLGAARAYVRRYTDSFPERALEGMRVGLYGHSAVGREIVLEILSALGAEVVRLGFSEAFVSVDTEAIRPEDARLARDWAREHAFDSIVSTDGDSDRPLVSDERGRFVRGDVAGILSARYLGATDVVTPVSSSSAAERSGAFRRVLRTRIGSPYVIEGMNAARASGGDRIVGYEANGGFLTASPIPLARGELSPLPTRDAVIVMLGILAQAHAQNRSVSSLLDTLPARHTASDRLANFPSERSQPRLEALARAGADGARDLFGSALGPVKAVDTIDGVRMEFESGEIVHLRASGNAPELRCYTEAASHERAQELLALGLTTVERWR